MRKIIVFCAAIILTACIKVPPLDFFEGLSPAGETVAITDDDNLFSLGLANFSSKKVFFCMYDGEINNLIEITPATYQFVTLTQGAYFLGVIHEASGGNYFAALSPSGKHLVGVNKENKDQMIQAIINGNEKYSKESSYFVSPENLAELKHDPEHFKALAFYDNQVVINTLDMITERDEKTSDKIVIALVCGMAFLGICLGLALTSSV